MMVLSTLDFEWLFYGPDAISDVAASCRICECDKVIITFENKKFHFIDRYRVAENVCKFMK